MGLFMSNVLKFLNSPQFDPLQILSNFVKMLFSMVKAGLKGIHDFP